jgi:hypothetical protein
MAAFHIGEIVFPTVGDDALALVLEAAAQEGGSTAYPSLYALLDPASRDDPAELIDEIARLGATEPGHQVAVLLGRLRDDLMQAMAAAGEG